MYANMDKAGDFMPHLPATGGGGGGSVNSVTAGDATITIGGTATDPTVAVTSGTFALVGTTITAGAGLTGGGSLAANRTIDVGAGTGISVAADSVAVDQTFAPSWTGQHNWSNTSVPGIFEITDGAAAAQIEGLRIRHMTSTTATAGIGVYLGMFAENGAGTAREAARIIGLLRTVTDTAENGAMIFQHINAGSLINCGHTANAGLYGASNISIGTISATGSTTTLAQWSIASSMSNFASSSAAQGGHSFTGTVNTSGARQFFVITPSANTGSTAGTEVKKFQYQAYTHQFASNTAVSTQREFCIEAPTYAFASATGTISDAATLYVSGAPIVGTNAAITRAYSLWTDDGDVRHDNIGVALGGGSTATLGTIGGSGPASAAQNKWMRLNIDGSNVFVPVWV